MNKFFSIYTYTTWDNLKTEELTHVKLLSLKNIFNNFPIIEPGFFDDLRSNLYDHKHYSWVKAIKRIVGPNNEDYNTKNWNFIWAMDNERRIFQYLFQKIQSGKDSQGILVALAPPELCELFKKHGSSAILKTLTLLNIPNKIKFLMILAPKGKSIAEEYQLFQINKNDIEKLKFINHLKKMPNIKGQWFPSFETKCPICNELLTNIKGYRIGYAKLVCPYCGYEV